MNNHKGMGIYAADNSFDLSKLSKFRNHKEHFPGLVSKSSFTMQKGYAASNDFNNFLRDCRCLIADNNNVLFVVEAIRECVGDFETDEGSKQSVECWFEAKKKGSYSHQKNINDETWCADSCTIVFVENCANNVGAAAAAANTVKKSRTDASQRTADDAGK